MKSPPKGRSGKNWPLLKLGSGPTEPEQGLCASSHRVLTGPIVGDSVSSFHSVLRIHVCICEHVCVHVSTCSRVHTCVFMHMCVHLHVCMCYMSICVPMLVLKCVHLRLCTCVPVCVHTCCMLVCDMTPPRGCRTEIITYARHLAHAIVSPSPTLVLTHGGYKQTWI